MESMYDQWESRENHGATKLHHPTPCAKCGKFIEDDSPLYLVRRYKTAITTAPAFYYYHPECDRRFEESK